MSAARAADLEKKSKEAADAALRDQYAGEVSETLRLTVSGEETEGKVRVCGGCDVSG